MGADHALMDLLGHSVVGKSGESPREGGLAGEVPEALPATELAERGAGAQCVKKCGGGGKLIDALGQEGVDEPDPGVGRTAVADPGIAAQEGAEVGQGNGLDELLVQLTQRPDFLGEGGEELALEVLPEIRKRERHNDPIKIDRKRSK